MSARLPISGALTPPAFALLLALIQISGYPHPWAQIPLQAFPGYYRVFPSTALCLSLAGSTLACLPFLKASRLFTSVESLAAQLLAQACGRFPSCTSRLQGLSLCACRPLSPVPAALAFWLKLQRFAPRALCVPPVGETFTLLGVSSSRFSVSETLP